MAIQYRQRPNSSKVDVIMTACPYCSQPLRERQGFGDHYQADCPHNPQNND